MRTLTLMLIAFCFTTSLHFSHAQETKIGYTNIELILAYMPEMTQLNKSIDAYENQLSQEYSKKDAFLRDKYATYMDMKEKGLLTIDQQQATEKEIMKLDEELQKFTSESEVNVDQRYNELLEPILVKMQNAIDATAQQGGYTYVINQTTSTGVSTILYGPDDNDLTLPIMEKLGIDVSKF